MLACFLMVLGQLPLRKTAKILKLTLTLTGGNFPWGQQSGYLSSRLQLQYKIYFQKGSLHILRNLRGGRGVVSKMLMHNYAQGGRGVWLYGINKLVFLQSEIVLKQKTTINYLLYIFVIIIASIHFHGFPLDLSAFLSKLTCFSSQVYVQKCQDNVIFSKQLFEMY